LSNPNHSLFYHSRERVRFDVVFSPPYAERERKRKIRTHTNSRRYYKVRVKLSYLSCVGYEEVERGKEGTLISFLPLPLALDSKLDEGERGWRRESEEKERKSQ